MANSVDPDQTASEGAVWSVSALFAYAILSLFFPVHLFHIFYYLFSPFLWEMVQNDPQMLMCH